MTDKPVIAWLDLETTGLDPKHHALLEVALIITDWDLNQIDDGYTAVVQYTSSTAKGLREKANDYVKAMHDRTGLWERLEEPSAKSLTTIDKELYEYLRWFAPEQNQARLGGNSVGGLDAAFSEVYLPQFKEHLHYQVLDMSSLQEAATQWFGIPDFPKSKEHSALADIRESIGQARYIREELSNLNK